MCLGPSLVISLQFLTPFPTNGSPRSLQQAIRSLPPTLNTSTPCPPLLIHPTAVVIMVVAPMSGLVEGVGVPLHEIDDPILLDGLPYSWPAGQWGWSKSIGSRVITLTILTVPRCQRHRKGERRAAASQDLINPATSHQLFSRKESQYG